MCTCVSSKNMSFQLLPSSSSIKVEEDQAPRITVMEKQGIVSILGSDIGANIKSAASLRRTLSADMSSKKWLAQNGFTSFSPMKKIASSEELANSAADHHHSSFSSSSSSSEGEEDHRPAQDDVWRSIQSEKEKRAQQPSDVWSWSSILSQKNEESSKQLPPPYIHPSVKRSTSCLSEKSLDICTESLGSETGSDGFSSYPPSETSEAEEEKDNDQRPRPRPRLSQSYEDLRSVKYSYSSRKSSPRSFPPPLASLTREDRSSVQMQSYRENGRLVLEAVSVPPQNYFQVQREDGRLLLTFFNTTSSQEEVEEEMEDDDGDQEFEQVFDNFEEIEEVNVESKFDDQEDEEAEVEEGDRKVLEKEKGRRELEIVMEKNSRLMPGGLMDVHVHKPTLMMKKLMGLDKKNLAWAPRFNKAVNLEEMEMEVDQDQDHEFGTPIPQPLAVPPRRVARMISAPQATTASFNAYEYFWREKPTMASIIKPADYHQQSLQPLTKSNQNKVILASTNHVNTTGYEYDHEQQNLVVMRGNKGDYLVPLLRRCKESRSGRSLLLWEPYCIATS